MNLVKQFFKQTKWFFISALIVLFIVFLLGQLSPHYLSENGLYHYINLHPFMWVIIRAMIIIGFILVWPFYAKKCGSKYNWSNEYIMMVIQRRWRYAAWLVVIDFVFQIL